ncbi:MAG: molybdopterin-dependent oxidoreductase [Myxococcota bacterium]
MKKSVTKRSGIERRQFIQVLATATGGTVLPLNFGCGLDGAVVVNSRHKPTLDAPLTPLQDFYINANYGIPDNPRSPSTYRLHLNGLVDNERRLSLDEIRALPPVEKAYTLECIGNRPGGGLISSQVFTGVRLADVMALAGVRDDARGLYLVGLDGYPIIVPRRVLDNDDALLVHSLGGQPLDANHGAPLRALFPNRYGMFSVKWLDSITVVREWAKWGAFRGLSSAFDGVKATQSRLDTPGRDQAVTRGEPVLLTGLAVSAGPGIDKVEVRTDRGWEEADLVFNTLEDDWSGLLWTLFSFEWTPEREGEIFLAVRATDTEGEGQSFDRRFPYDSSSIHTVRVLVRE